jgi:hypothetical protein
MRYLVCVLARTMTILAVFHGFLQSLKANAMVMPIIRSWPYPFRFIIQLASCRVVCDTELFVKYSKHPVIWHVWGVGCSSFMNLVVVWEKRNRNSVFMLFKSLQISIFCFEVETASFCFRSCMGVFLEDSRLMDERLWLCCNMITNSIRLCCNHESPQL